MGNSLGYDDESVDEESLSGIVNQDEFPSLEEQAASAAAFKPRYYGRPNSGRIEF